MQLGMFLMPAHDKGTAVYDAVQWDLQMIRWADELGFTEAWIGEHFTSPYEPVPAPDLLIAQALVAYVLDLFSQVGFLKFFKHDPELPDSAVTPEYLAEHNWIIGSPETVTRKLTELHTALGGYGTTLVLGYDYSGNPTAWRHSMELLAHEVAPRVADL